ncbi:MAG: hypothetical protein NTW06_01005, partial [Candidatus Falkowbacteria bacterium]|nr:hypothetical protein [Candidatus Falkowbacteria bacterium]
MRKKITILILLTLLFTSISSVKAEVQAPTFRIMTQSDSGDYIGQNKSWDFSSSNNSKITISQAGGSMVSFDASSFSVSYMNFGFAAESGKTLSPGLYTPAKRLPFRDSFNGIEVSGDGRGCNTILGAFYVHEYVVTNGSLEKAAIDFVQICEPKSNDINATVPKLYGSIRYNSSIADSCNSQGCAEAKKNVGITVVSAKPDLVIGNIISPTAIDKRIIIEVKNAGAAATTYSEGIKVSASLRDSNGALIALDNSGYQYINNLSPNGTTSVTFNVGGNLTNSMTLNVWLDNAENGGSGFIDESNENNNSLEKTISVNNSTSLPDLTVSSIVFSAQKMNEEGTLSVSIKNLGANLTSGAGLTNWYNNFSAQNFIFSNVTPSITSYNVSRNLPTASDPLITNESITFSWKGKFNTFGNLYLQFTVDNANELAESNENNNTLSQSIIVDNNLSSNVKLGDGTYELKEGDKVQLNNGLTIVPVYFVSGSGSNQFFNVKFDVYKGATKITTTDYTRVGWEMKTYNINNSFSISNNENYSFKVYVESLGQILNIWNSKITFKSEEVTNNQINSKVTILQPNGDEQYKIGDTIKIKWQGGKEAVDLVLVGKNATSKSEGFFADGFLYSIKLGALPSSEYLWNSKIACISDERCYDITPGYYKILAISKSTNGNMIYGNDGPNGDIANYDLSDKPFSLVIKDINNNDDQINKMNENANRLQNDKFDEILAELKQLRDQVKEQQNEIKYLKSLIKDVKNLSEQAISAINNFITYGVDTNTQKLGAGERAAVIYSYKSAFKKLPETEAELADAIKIANGRWPSATSTEAEKAAKEQFMKIYNRAADMSNAKDNAAI